MLFDSFATSRNSIWTLVGAGILFGIATGFTVPLAASYQPRSYFRSSPVVSTAVLEVPTVIPTPSSYDVDRDSEVERLEARNRRLLAMLATLRKKQAASSAKPAAIPQLTSQAVFGQN